MLVDRISARTTLTMFTVDYEPAGAAQPHDHPFEEAYFFLPGRSRPSSTGSPTRSGPATSCSPRSAGPRLLQRRHRAGALARDPGAAAPGTARLSLGGRPGRRTSGEHAEDGGRTDDRSRSGRRRRRHARIGLELARHYADAGRRGDPDRARPRQRRRRPSRSAAAGASAASRFDLAEPETIAPALADIGPVHRLVLVAIERDHNTSRDYDIARAIRLVTLKLVGYTEVVHALLDRLTDDASIVLFGGMAKERPYPGSTTVTTVNGGVVGPDPDARRELRPHPGQLDPSGHRRRQPVLGAKAGGDRPVHVGDAHRAGWPRWPRSWTRRCSCSRTGGERGRPDRRWRLALPLTASVHPAPAPRAAARSPTSAR